MSEYELLKLSARGGKLSVCGHNPPLLPMNHNAVVKLLHQQTVCVNITDLFLVFFFLRIVKRMTRLSIRLDFSSLKTSEIQGDKTLAKVITSLLWPRVYTEN